jgi:phosphoserine aminotransferase
LESDQLLAVDATSSMGGIALPFSCGDVWFASVQKCFGLPAGMAVMILSPKAIAKARQRGEKAHYNSLQSIIENAGKFQTHHTPNVLGIYLMKRTMEASAGIVSIEEKLLSRYRQWETFIDAHPLFDWLVEEKNSRSKTVLTLSCPDPAKVKQRAREAHIIIGNGYGPWAESTVRIANFPAIEHDEITALQSVLFTIL